MGTVGYNTALGYRNAIKWPLELAFNIHTDESEFALLAKSHFLANPPAQKVIPNWNLGEAIQSLSIKGEVADLPRKKRFLACLFIIAVATGNRASELANLDANLVYFAPDNSEVRLAVLPGFLCKNQTPNRSPPPIKIPALRDPVNNNLCPLNAVSLILRGRSQIKNNLFTNPETGAALTASTLSYWLCKAINWLVPNSIPTARAHDVRKAATSLAWVRGVPLHEIVKQGFWSSSSPFLRRYLHNSATPANTNCVAAGSRA